MEKKPEFHGSDLEKIAEYYHIIQDKIVRFGANVNPLGLSEKIKAELADNLDIISSYPDRDYKSLRQTIGNYCQAPPEHIVVGNGSTELISLLITQLSAKKALILGPTYSEYERELALTGGTLTEYYLDESADFRLNTDDFLSVLTDDLDLVIICNPNNPTSSAIHAADLERIVSHCQHHDIFVMVDETYAEFAPKSNELLHTVEGAISQMPATENGITAIPLTARFQNLMVIRGVSKFFAAPGLRFGYGITSSRTFLNTLHTHQNPWSLNSVGAFAGERMLKDVAYIQKTWELIDSERTRICRRLQASDAVKIYPPYANFILVRILTEGVTSSDIFEAAIRKGMMIRDCSSFHGLDGEYIRFCLMNPEDNDRLVNCILQAVEK